MRRLLGLTILAFRVQRCSRVGERELLGLVVAGSCAVLLQRAPGDPDGLDGNNQDGIACESNPCPCYYGTATGPTPPPPPADSDADGVPDPSDACPTVPAATPTGCPPPPDTDGDGLTDDVDSCPTLAADTSDGCPRVLVGAVDTSGFGWTDRLQKPRLLVPCSGGGNCQVIRTKWRDWGEATATGRGIARFNDCKPFCAKGHFHKARGVRPRAYRLRDGLCMSEHVRYYTRVRVTWPKRSHLRRRTRSRPVAWCRSGSDGS
jgi:hypothetical protein